MSALSPDEAKLVERLQVYRSTRAATPQCLIPVDQVVDLPPLHQRGFLHQADQRIGMGLGFSGHGRSLAGREPLSQRNQLHAVSDDFAINLSGFEHGAQLAYADPGRQRGAG